MPASSPRRPIKFRTNHFAIKVARWLAAQGVKPNLVSLISVLFAFLAATALALSSIVSTMLHIILLLSAVVFIVLRLLCNLFDGMIAIEEGLATNCGAIYNELPDRPADSLILIGMGFAAHQVIGGISLGWLSALLATKTAYVRLLGQCVGTSQYFIGPMSKQHRMAIVIITCILSIILQPLLDSAWIFFFGLIVITGGCLLTIGLRLKKIISVLKEEKSICA